MRSIRARHSGRMRWTRRLLPSFPCVICRSPFTQGGRATLAVDRVSFDHRQGRDACAGGRVRIGQVGHCALDHEAAALSVGAAIHPARSISTARNCSVVGEREMRRVRGNEITIVFQEPMTSLNPLHTIETADQRNSAAAPRADRRCGAHADDRTPWPGRHPRSGGAARKPIRTSSQVGSASV